MLQEESLPDPRLLAPLPPGPTPWVGPCRTLYQPPGGSDGLSCRGTAKSVWPPAFVRALEYEDNHAPPRGAPHDNKSGPTTPAPAPAGGYRPGRAPRPGAAGPLRPLP